MKPKTRDRIIQAFTWASFTASLLTLATLLSSCTTEEPCECYEETYKTYTETVYDGKNRIMGVTNRNELVSITDAPCQPEGEEVTVWNDGSTVYYTNIKCY